MEWMLQLADEIDDAIGALRLCSLGVAAEFGKVAAGSLGIGAIAAAVATGAEISLMCSAVITLSLAATLKIRAIGRRVEPPLL